MALKTLNPPPATLGPPKPSSCFSLGDGVLRLPLRRPLAPGRLLAAIGGFPSLEGGGRERRGAVAKSVDLATLGNLCVDIVLNVPTLPPASKVERKAYMERLEASPPDMKFWEAGGNCNLVIAAARLGLSSYTLGHVGDEIYGKFLLDVLEAERITYVGMNENTDHIASAAYKTLLCWVLVDPFQKHGFCSRADFCNDPAFSWMSSLTERTKMAIHQSKILFCNGYAFDELVPDLIVNALDYAIGVGTTIFFDPGPRGKSLLHGSTDTQKALDKFLKLSDVLLLTSDEAESLTGIKNPIWAGQELIEKGVRTRWVVIKMGAKGSILISRSSVSCAPSFKVKVVDTVGCGDSFTAAIAFGFLHNMPAVSTLTLANAVGAATATGCGAGRNVAHLEKVLELLRHPNLAEDENFWNELIEDSLWGNEVFLLSSTSASDQTGCAIHTPMTIVAAELISEFESVYEGSRIQSS